MRWKESEMWKDYVPERWGKEFKLFKIRIFFRNNQMYIGSYEVEKGAEFGRHVRILHDVQIRRNVKIGDYSYIEPYTSVISANIGKFCSIGKCCQIGPWKHPTDYISTSPEILRKILKCPDLYSDLPQRAEIGNDVWIGSNSVIMGGVKIGNGAVIGAGAVVTKDVPDYAIAAGVPAKVIRYRFEEEVIKQLNALCWWDWTAEEMRRHKKLFAERENWIRELKNSGK